MLRTLYAGQLGTARAEAFTTFLAERVGPVRTASVADLVDVDQSDIDVLIVDGEPQEGEQPPAELDLKHFPKPTVLIGGVGARVSDTLRLKLGWQFGCLCLDHRAIVEPGTTDHQVFQGPHAVPAPSPE